MSRMFGDRIDEFVLSVDIMSEETLHDLLHLVATYLEQQLGVVYFAVLEEGQVDGRPGITTLWSSDDHRPVFSVDPDAGYSSCSAFAFGENQPLWLVSGARTALGDDGPVHDLWSGRVDLPSYRSSSERSVCTSVMHPMRRLGKPIGVVEFACSTYVEPTPASLEEVARLADTIARAYRMYDVTEVQKQNTDRALRLLESSLTSESWTRLALPQAFIAFPGGDHLDGHALADHRRVVETIRGVVKEFADQIHTVFWDEITQAGNITAQVIEHITCSEFGVCYFSEREASTGADATSTDGADRATDAGAAVHAAGDTPAGDQCGYVDNANVLFEAGMMQALANSPGGLMRAWIPIRERQGNPLPFDIATERILTVDRTPDGELDEPAFAAALRAAVGSLVAGLTPADA